MRVAKVFQPKKLNSGKMLGFVDISFSLTDGGNGCLTIRGFKIFKGKDGGIQVGLPSRKEGNEYYPLVSMDFENEDAKAFMNHVTEEVARAYNAAPSQGPTENTSSTSSSGGGITDEDLPF